MQMLLLSVNPNRLESLISNSTDLQQIISLAQEQEKLVLDDVRHALAHMFQEHQPLHYALNPEHLLDQATLLNMVVSYNNVIRVAEIYESINAIDERQLKKLYQPKTMHQAQLALMSWGLQPEQDLARIQIAFNQLQHFYFYAAEHNLAVIRVIGQDLFDRQFI